MAQQQTSTITADLLAYRDCREKVDSNEYCAVECVGVSPARGSQFGSFWKAVKSNRISHTLHRVVLLHNDVDRPRALHRFGFDTVRKLLQSRQGGGQWARFSPEKQDSALEASLGKPVEDATDEVLLRIRYSHFKRALAARGKSPVVRRKKRGGLVRSLGAE